MVCSIYSISFKPNADTFSCAQKEFDFDLVVDVENGNMIVIGSFALDANGINPAQTLSDISTVINDLLTNSGGQFVSLASSFDSSFNSATDLFADIAQNDKITLSLDANLNFEAKLNLSFDAINFSATINELSVALSAGIHDLFDISFGNLGDFHVKPYIELELQAENIATPFEISNTSALMDFQFTGSFDGRVDVGMDFVPVEISLMAYSSALLDADSLEFDVGLDINLIPIADSEFCLLLYHASLNEILFLQ